MPQKKPNIDVLLERLDANTKLTERSLDEIRKGFVALNGRVAKNTDEIRDLQFESKYDAKARKDEAERAKQVVDEAAAEAKRNLTIAYAEKLDTPTIGSNRWLLATLVTIILALITAIGVK